ncbi:hypothetical protein JYU34_008181 [Plutella xylostella]|uniref:Peptidase S1 domain-containing protein n=1 Tax=Plutella xylostella TaxID=51655 RepID=A0ABQ7QNX4_PLUXY|nr:hypothetical protein JYU34_008181 [Plutella xylostella]
MGAGQIGGIATLLDMEFNNAQGFLGVRTTDATAQYIVYFLSHSLLFCTGVILEPHVVMAPAVCVYGERNVFPVYAGSHVFSDHRGVQQLVEHYVVHRNFNRSDCYSDGLSIMVLRSNFKFQEKMPNAQFTINRVRYAMPLIATPGMEIQCTIHGWGSRRNGFLIPLLLSLQGYNVTVMHPSECDRMWNHRRHFLCVRQPKCESKKYGALCPDDVGTALVCDGYVQGMMLSHLVDRPCGVGYVNVTRYVKFMTCAVDDARDITGGHKGDESKKWVASPTEKFTNVPLPEPNLEAPTPEPTDEIKQKLTDRPRRPRPFPIRGPPRKRRRPTPKPRRPTPKPWPSKSSSEATDVDNDE